MTKQPTFEAPDSNAALRAGLVSGIVGLVVVVVVTVLVGRTHIDADAVRSIVARSQVGPLAASMVVMSAAFLFLGKRWSVLFPPPHGTVHLDQFVQDDISQSSILGQACVPLNAL